MYHLLFLLMLLHSTSLLRRVEYSSYLLVSIRNLSMLREIFFPRCLMFTLISIERRDVGVRYPCPFLHLSSRPLFLSLREVATVVVKANVAPLPVLMIMIDFLMSTELGPIIRRRLVRTCIGGHNVVHLVVVVRVFHALVVGRDLVHL